MHPEIFTLSTPCYIIGRVARTRNDNGQSMRDIPPFWQKFYQNPIKEKIPQRRSDDIYVVYTNFENRGRNNHGMYDMIIGYAVKKPIIEIPEGMVSATIPSGNYATFVHQGPPTSLGQSWAHIEKYTASDKKFAQQKSYHTEWEHHRTDGDITIYIGLKSQASLDPSR